MRELLDKYCGKAKSVRKDILQREKVISDFNLPECIVPDRICQLKQILIRILFAETTYCSGSNYGRTRFSTMSDSQFELYDDTVTKIYDILLEARKTSIDENLNVWNLNSSNVPDYIRMCVEKDDYEFSYIHEGEEIPRKGE